MRPILTETERASVASAIHFDLSRLYSDVVRSRLTEVDAQDSVAINLLEGELCRHYDPEAVDDVLKALGSACLSAELGAPVQVSGKHPATIIV